MTYEEQKRISSEIVSHAIDVLSTRAEGCEDAAWEIAQTDPLFLRASTTKKGWLQVAEKMIAYRWAEKCKQARREADALISRQFAEECKQVYGDWRKRSKIRNARTRSKLPGDFGGYKRLDLVGGHSMVSLPAMLVVPGMCP